MQAIIDYFQSSDKVNLFAAPEWSRIGITGRFYQGAEYGKNVKREGWAAKEERERLQERRIGREEDMSSF
jgi:hypothetical protein